MFHQSGEDIDFRESKFGVVWSEMIHRFAVIWSSRTGAKGYLISCHWMVWFHVKESNCFIWSELMERLDLMWTDRTISSDVDRFNDCEQEYLFWIDQTDSSPLDSSNQFFSPQLMKQILLVWTEQSDPSLSSWSNLFLSSELIERMKWVLLLWANWTN
jgi:hypothetical protein